MAWPAKKSTSPTTSGLRGKIAADQNPNPMFESVAATDNAEMTIEGWSIFCQNCSTSNNDKDFFNGLKVFASRGWGLCELWDGKNKTVI